MIFDKLEKRNDKNKETYTFEDLFKRGLENEDDTLKCNTYFSCLKVISESVAKCPINIKQETAKGEKTAKEHYLYETLRLIPNPYMNMIDVIKVTVLLMKHFGVGGIYIDRDASGRVKNLYPCRVSQILIDNVGLLKTSKDNAVLVDFDICGTQGTCFYKDIIVLKDFTLNGINTKATRNILKDTMSTNIKSQNYLNTLFDNGLTNKICVQLTNDIKDTKELNKIQQKFNRIYSSNGRTFVVPAGFNVSSLNLSLADAQFAEIRKMSTKEIAASMGVPLSKLGDLSESNNNSLEQTNIAFLSDTLQIIIEQLESEFDTKLLTLSDRKQGYKCRFNINVLLRTSADIQSQVLSRYVDKGIYTINDARRILGFEDVEAGDSPLVASGYYLLKDLEMITKGKIIKDLDKNLKGGEEDESTEGD